MSSVNAPEPYGEETFEAWQVKLVFADLCGLYYDGKLTLEGLRAALGELVVYDSAETLWMIGVRSGNWYRWLDNSWIEASEPEGLLTLAQRGANPIRSESFESHGVQETFADRKTRRSRELEEDRRAEEDRVRRGLTPDQELEEIKRTRPAFIEDYDKREHQTLLWLWYQNKEREKTRQGGAMPYNHPLPDRPWLYDLEKYLNELTPDQLRSYDNWKRRIDCFSRRFPEKWIS